MSGRLGQRADALRAEHFLNFVSVLEHRYFLQVRAEGSVGRPVGERNAVTEGSGLTTMSAFCHFSSSFLADDSGLPLRQAAYFTMNRIHVQAKGY